MLFRKNIEPACVYCARGSGVTDTEIVCKRRGIVAPWEKCNSFKYDPYKRDPPKPPELKKVKIEPDEVIAKPPIVETILELR